MLKYRYESAFAKTVNRFTKDRRMDANEGKSKRESSLVRTRAAATSTKDDTIEEVMEEKKGGTTNSNRKRKNSTRCETIPAVTVSSASIATRHSARERKSVKPLETKSSFKAIKLEQNTQGRGTGKSSKKTDEIEQADSFIFQNLSVKVFASVLGTYSTGKSMSTFVLAAFSDSTFRSTVYAICRKVLVERYMALSTKILHIYKELDLETEISTILDIVQGDIRLSTDADDQIMNNFSQWCAILDYFEVQLEATTSMQTLQASYLTCPQWIVWSGKIELKDDKELTTFLTTPDWTVCASPFWNNLNEYEFRLTPPESYGFQFIAKYQKPYGTLFGMDASARSQIERECSDLRVRSFRDTTDVYKYTLIPEKFYRDEEVYLMFMDHSFIRWTHANIEMTTGPLLIDPGHQSLSCCWDQNMVEDSQEDCISHLGENVICIMKSFEKDFTVDLLKDLYKDCSEFRTGTDIEG